MHVSECDAEGAEGKPMSVGTLGTEGMAEAPQPGLPARRRLSSLSRWLLWTAGIVLVLLIALGAAADILLHRAAPMLRASLIDTLQKRFQARVELDNLSVSVLDGFWVEGRGLRVWLPQATTPDPANAEPWRTQPWITADKLKFHASWRILPGKPIEVSVIHVEGARIQLPPKEDRPHLNGKTSETGARPASGNAIFHMPQIQVRRIECDQAQLILEHRPEPGKPAKDPLDFELNKITLIPDGKGGPVSFSVDMVNAKPIGTIHSTGHVGPLTAIQSDPGALPVDGDYAFDHADLSTIKGIAGILSSTGHYAGTLREIDVDGQTETPDFRLESSHKGTGVMLTTRFHAIVDGTNGNTQLQPVDATLGHTHFIARGEVVRAQDAGTGNGNPKAHGHDITLDVTMDRGRIEDILAIAANAEKPFMTGNLTLRTAFHLPPNLPGQQSPVFDRLQLNGQFHLSQARFNNSVMQGKIEDLSMRGQGKPDEVKTTDPASIFSAVQGHFTLAAGSLQLPDLDYSVPGAKILAHGAYGLQGGTLSFEGDAKLDAEISNVVGGWKGLLLKPMDHYLKKNGAGTDVPIHIQGTRKEPKFGVDFDRLGKTDKTDKTDKPEHPEPAKPAADARKP
jgi:hypothetical protein